MAQIMRSPGRSPGAVTAFPDAQGAVIDAFAQLFAGLKKGAPFSGTATASPVRGLRPSRAPPLLDDKGAEAAQLHAIPASQRRRDFVEHRRHQPLDVATVEMRVVAQDSIARVAIGS